MADLHQFVRQHFFENNWAKECDISNIPVERLKEISEVSKYIESVTLQALDEEDSFIRAIATILHSRQNFGHLTFDISDTNDHFDATLRTLSSLQFSDAPTSKVPLLAAVLDARITNATLSKGGSANQHEAEINGTCLNSSCGFRLREESSAQRMKEAYLDRLQEECERRRKHVPIPGRSFGKHDSDDSSFDGHHHDNDHHQPSVGLASRRAPNFPRKASVVRKPDLLTGRSAETASTVVGSTPGLNARAKLLAMHNRSMTGGSAGESNSFNVTSSSAGTAAKRRPTGIKLLDFEDLPATGLQAKKLRKEQQEREREAKRREREEKAQERRDAREASRISRLRELATAAGVSSPPSTLSATGVTSTLAPLPTKEPSYHTAQEEEEQSSAVQALNWQPWTPFGVVVPHIPPTSSVLSSQRTGENHYSNRHTDEDDDDDLEDEEEDEECVTADGAFQLTAPRGFRGFISQPQQQQMMRPPQQPTATFVLQPAGLPIQQVSPGQPGLVAAAPNALFSAAATAVQPRIRFIRPLLTTTNQPQQTTVINPTAPTPTAMAPATPARFVQLADGTFALIATAPRPPQPLQPQSNQLAPTVFIAGPGAAIATAAGATGFRVPAVPTGIAAQRPSVSCFPNGGGPAVTFASPALNRLPTPQTRMLIGVPTPMDISQQPITTAATLAPLHHTASAVQARSPSILRPQQPRLIQIRPRMLSTTAPRQVAAAQQQQRCDYIFAPPPPSSGGAPTLTTSSSVVASAQPTLMKIAPQPANTTVVSMVTAPQQPHQEAPQQRPVAPMEQLHLTPTQYQNIQSLFAGANRLSRPDKALILAFLTGKGENPHPEAGNVLRIHLSEYREYVKDAATGNILEVAADTHIHLDYATGKFERVKSYRTLPPDQLQATPASP